MPGWALAGVPEGRWGRGFSGQEDGGPAPEGRRAVDLWEPWPALTPRSPSGCDADAAGSGRLGEQIHTPVWMDPQVRMQAYPTEQNHLSAVF